MASRNFNLLRHEKVDVWEYFEHLESVFEKQDLEIKSKLSYIDKVDKLFSKNPSTMSNDEFVNNLSEHVKKGKLSLELSTANKLLLKLATSGYDVPDEKLGAFRDELVDQYNLNPNVFLGKLHKTNQNSKGLVNAFKEFVYEMDEFVDYGLFNFEPGTITTHKRDSMLNALLKAKYGVDFNYKGVDAIAVTKQGQVMAIEHKYVGEVGGGQYKNITECIEVASKVVGPIMGLGILDGDIAINTSDYKIFSDICDKADGRLITSYSLATYIKNN